jgi:hypothetical protein
VVDPQLDNTPKRNHTKRRGGFKPAPAAVQRQAKSCDRFETRQPPVVMRL